MTTLAIRRFMCVVSLLLSMATGRLHAQEPVAKTSWTFGGEVFCPVSGCSPLLSAYMEHQPAKGRVGAYAFTLMTRGWSEAYGGATYSPTTWSQLGMGAGLEQADMPLRLNAFAAAWGKPGVLFATVEWGGSGWWYHTHVLFNTPVSWLKVGAMSRAYSGTGLRVEAMLWHAKVFVAPLLSHEDRTPSLLGGVRFTF